MEWFNWILTHKLELIGILSLLIGAAEIVVKLTPTEKDNSVLDKIKNLIGVFIPNLKKGGGRH